MAAMSDVGSRADLASELQSSFGPHLQTVSRCGPKELCSSEARSALEPTSDIAAMAWKLATLRLTAWIGKRAAGEDQPGGQTAPFQLSCRGDKRDAKAVSN